jgi:hypothetical protein
MNKANWLTLIILLILSLPLFAAGIMIFLRRRLFIYRGILVIGKIHSIETIHHSRGHSWIPLIYYCTLNGDEFFVRPVHFTPVNPIRYSVGQSVAVIYDPQFPEKATIATVSSNDYLSFFLIIIGGLLVFIGIMLYFII